MAVAARAGTLDPQLPTDSISTHSSYMPSFTASVDAPSPAPAAFDAGTFPVSSLSDSFQADPSIAAPSALPGASNQMLRPYSGRRSSMAYHSSKAPASMTTQDEPSAGVRITAVISDYGFEVALAIVVLGGSVWLYLHDPLGKRQPA